MQDDIIARARKVAVEVLRVEAPEVDAQGGLPVRNLAALQAAGIMAAMVPRALGGAGADLATFATIASILAEECLSTALVWSMHSQQVAVVAEYGTDEQKARILRGVVERGDFLASATTEPRGGGHILTCHSVLEASGDGFLMTRSAPIVTGGQIAEWFLTTVRSSKDAPLNSVSLAIAHRDGVRISADADWDVMGVRGTASVPAEIETRLGRDDFIGGLGGFNEIAVRSMIPLGHLAWSACWVGATWGAYKHLMQVLRAAGAKGAVDLKSDLLIERLARIRVDIDSMRAFLGYVVDQYVARLAATDAAATARTATSFDILINNLKIFASERAFEAIDRMVQVAGVRNGYFRASRLERVFRDLRSGRLMYANDRLLVASGRLGVIEARH